MSGPPIVYCENGALSSRLKELKAAGKIRLKNFPADAAPSKKIAPDAAIPAAYWEDMGVIWDKIETSLDEMRGSDKFEEILGIIGPAHRRDALHVDSAIKTGAVCFVTADRDILDVASRLTDLTGLPIFRSDDEALYTLLTR